MECIHHTLAILPTSHNFCLMFANQLSADKFGTWLIAKLFCSGHEKLQNCGATSNITILQTSRFTNLRTCSCELQELRSCSCTFKNPETSLRTCSCELRKLKFDCGFVNLKKNLWSPALVKCVLVPISNNVNHLNQELNKAAQMCIEPRSYKEDLIKMSS